MKITPKSQVASTPASAPVSSPFGQTKVAPAASPVAAPVAAQALEMNPDEDYEAMVTSLADFYSATLTENTSDIDSEFCPDLVQGLTDLCNQFGLQYNPDEDKTYRFAVYKDSGYFNGPNLHLKKVGGVPKVVLSVGKKEAILEDNWKLSDLAVRIESKEKTSTCYFLAESWRIPVSMTLVKVEGMDSAARAKFLSPKLVRAVYVKDLLPLLGESSQYQSLEGQTGTFRFTGVEMVSTDAGKTFYVLMSEDGGKYFLPGRPEDYATGGEDYDFPWTCTIEPGEIAHFSNADGMSIRVSTKSLKCHKLHELPVGVYKVTKASISSGEYESAIITLTQDGEDARYYGNSSIKRSIAKMEQPCSIETPGILLMDSKSVSADGKNVCKTVLILPEQLFGKNVVTSAIAKMFPDFHKLGENYKERYELAFQWAQAQNAKFKSHDSQESTPAF